MKPTELIQDLYAAFGRGDIAYVLARVAPGCQWIVNADGVPTSGVYVGPEGVADFFQTLAATEEILRFEPREFFEHGNGVVALGFEECRVIATGKTVSTNWAMHFRVSEGKVIHFETFYNSAAYAKAHEPSREFSGVA